MSLFGEGKVAQIGGLKSRQLIQVLSSPQPSRSGDGNFLTQAAADVRYASLGHTHSISQVIGLQDALDGKLSSSGLTPTPNSLIKFNASGSGLVASECYADDGYFFTDLRARFNTAATPTDIQWSPISGEGLTLFGSPSTIGTAYHSQVYVNNLGEAAGAILGNTYFAQKVSGKSGTNPGLKARIRSETIGSGGAVGGFGGKLILSTRADNAAGMTDSVVIAAAGTAITGTLSTTDNIQIGKGHSDTPEAGSCIQWRASIGGSIGWAMQLSSGYELDYWAKSGSTWNRSARMSPGGLGLYSPGTSDTVLGSPFLRIATDVASPTAGWTLQIGTAGDLAFWGFNGTAWVRAAQLFENGDVTFVGVLSGASLSVTGAIGCASLSVSGIVAGTSLNIGGDATVNDLFLPTHVHSDSRDGALLFLDGSLGGKVRAMDGSESSGGAIYCDAGGIHFEAKINIAASVAPNYGAGMNFEASIDPATPQSGDLWFDGTNVKMRIGSTTKTFVMA